MTREQVTGIINEVNGGKVTADHRGVYSIRFEGELLPCGKFGEAMHAAERVIEDLGAGSAVVCLEGTGEYRVTAERLAKFGLANEIRRAGLAEAEDALSAAIDRLLEAYGEYKAVFNDRGDTPETRASWERAKEAELKVMAERDRVRVTRTLWAKYTK